MKPILFLFPVLLFFNSFSQQEELQIQGRIVDKSGNPVPDAYVINLRNMDKNTTRDNGVFDAHVLPTDSLIITHVSFFRKIITVYSLMKNPVVQLSPDTINIPQIDVLSNQMTDAERAKQNIENIDFDFRPKPGGDI
jgi:hypothetical protein